MIGNAKRVLNLFLHIEWPIPMSTTTMPICHPSPSAFMQSRQRRRVALVALLLGMTALPTLAACPSSAPGRFIPNGAEVKDTRTGLVWARCSVGQSWNGAACIGSISRMSHEQALVHAKGQTGWRLPDVKELSSLVDRGCKKPSIDTTAFPGTPDTWYWTATPRAMGDYAGRSSGWVWAVEFKHGNTTAEEEGVVGRPSASRREFGAVRLVRMGS